MKPTFNSISVCLLLFLSKGLSTLASSNIFVEEALTECSLHVGDKADNNENIHRRMVSMNMPLSCEDSDVIMMDIPHDGSKRFFSKTSTTATTQKDESSSSPRYSSWVGEDESDGSMLMFVQDEEGHMSGSMLDLKNDHVVHLRTQEDGSYNAVITPSSEFPPGKDPKSPPPDVSQRKLVVSEQDPLSTETKSNQQNHMSLPYKALDENSSRSLLDDSGGNLDVMVVWTKSAECANSGLSEGCTLTDSTQANMEALMNLAILETNTAYAASGVNTELHLTHAYRHPTYTEYWSFEDDITEIYESDPFSNGLEDATNGQISDVHTNRATYGADIVALIINDSTYCGLGWIGPRIEFMYSVTDYSCATGIYAFGHEIGHNLGLYHDRGTDDTCGGSGYNYGYRDPQANFRTVMAYDCQSRQCDNNVGGGCTTIPRYSNPNFTYNGLALGTASIDSARAINDVRVQVAAYYPHKSSNTASPTTTPTAAPNATPTPPTSTSCTDSSLRIKIKKDGKFIMRDCIWVSNKSTQSRCALNGVSSTCSETCNTCSSCIDSPLRLKIFWQEKFIRRDCEWVNNRQTDRRCAVPGVADACRATCGKC